MATPSQPASEQSLTDLVRSATQDIQSLVNDQIELTKAEVRGTVQTAGKSAGLLGAAAFLAIFFFLFLLLTIAFVLTAIGLPMWAGFGIVALVLGIVAAILGLVGKKRMNTVGGPERSIAAAKGSADSVKSALTTSSPSPSEAPALQAADVS